MQKNLHVDLKLILLNYKPGNGRQVLYSKLFQTRLKTPLPALSTPRFQAIGVLILPKEKIGNGSDCNLSIFIILMNLHPKSFLFRIGICKNKAQAAIRC
jgi:hypothetical protein